MRPDQKTMGLEGLGTRDKFVARGGESMMKITCNERRPFSQVNSDEAFSVNNSQAIELCIPASPPRPRIVPNDHINTICKYGQALRGENVVHQHLASPPASSPEPNVTRISQISPATPMRG